MRQSYRLVKERKKKNCLYVGIYGVLPRSDCVRMQHVEVKDGQSLLHEN